MIKIAIVGAGRGGAALLELFHSSDEVKVVGITDRFRDSPGLTAARRLGVPVAAAINEFFDANPDMVINATGDPAVSKTIKDDFPYYVEVIEGRGARLLWDLVDTQRQAKTDLGVLYQTGLVLSKSKDLKDVLDAVLESALELTGTQAGCIALAEGAGRGEMRLAASLGMEAASSRPAGFKTSEDSLASIVVAGAEPVEWSGAPKDNARKDSILSASGAKAALACALRINGDLLGILYIIDWKGREFTGRDKGLIKLFSSQAAHAIEKFKLMHKLEESLTSLEGVFDDSQDMIIAADVEGRIVRFSKGGERVLGYTEAEARGKYVDEFYYDKAERAKVIRLMKERGAVYNYEAILVKKDGSPVDISLTISELKDKAGAVIGTVGVSKDVTVERRLRRELEELNRNLEEKVMERTRDLERANKELKKANELKGRFIANASHELRTPLHSIIGFSEILVQKSFGPLNEKQEKFLSTIFTSGKHLLHLVNNILDLAKIEAGKAQLQYEKFQMKTTIDEVVMVVAPLADRKLITVEKFIDPAAAEFVADKVKFKQVLYNLVSNAIKFTPESGRVTIRAARILNDGALPWAGKWQEFLKFSVEDTGPGIKPEDRERIFDEFEQLDSSKNTEGTGLGLSLTKKLIEIHGGHITVGGGQGAVFDVYLPIVSAQEAITAQQQPSAPSPEFHTPAMTEDGATVLVVEDDLPTVELITIHLTQAGYKVAHAYDGEEAIRKAREIKPFVITLDIMLPKKDGWEVLQALKSSHETRDIPVIIHSIIENTELAFALGATDYIVKPLDHSTLIDKLTNIARERKKGRSLSVLLVSGDHGTRDYVSRTLQGGEVVLHHALDEEGGVDLAVAMKPNAIIVDVEDPEKGFGVIRRLKHNVSLMETPLFVLTSQDISTAEKHLLTGHVSRILKKDTLGSGELVSHLKGLEVLYPEKAGLVDEVTSVFNRRYMKIRLSQEISRSLRYNLPLVLLMLELDNFDHYAAAKGEYYGNLVLKKTAEILKKGIRGSDVLVRYDRCAFSLILTNTVADAGVVLARRFLNTIHDYPFIHEDCLPTGTLTISIGAAELKTDTMEEIIQHAGASLADARGKGGNKLEVYRPKTV
ncbi:MAG: diguanylate cyclase [Deltaproteobacteria bacterium]|nr:diguanylate cyclase [Deltaproteobacteria bacterium]